MSRLQGKVAVVTGGTTGIGLASASRFSREGAKVFVLGRRLAAVEEAVQVIGSGAVGVQGDVSRLEDLDRFYAKIAENCEGIDILFANAGGGEFAALTDVTEEHYDKTFDINVKGTLFTVQKALPLMRDGGSIILTGSTAGIKGTPNFSVYSASKAAIRNLARSWILELAPRSIRVNVLAPGATWTPGWRGLASSDQELKAMQAATEASIPIGRLGTVEEVSNAVLFLASDESSFVNGSELFVDGGSAQI